MFMRLGWLIGGIAGTLAVMFPFPTSPTISAAQSRMLTVQYRDSGSRVLEAFSSAAVSAGMECRSQHTENTNSVSCHLNPAERGNLYAVDVTEKRWVVVSAYSSDVTSPHGEVDPVMEQALEDFTIALMKIPDVEAVEQCVAPHPMQCSPLYSRK